MRESLSQLEQLVLWGIVRLRGKAYGMSLRQEIEDRAGRHVPIGSLYMALERLESKGFVSSSEGDPTPERGGRAKRYFVIEARGAAALREAHVSLRAMSAGVAGLLEAK